SVPGAYRVHGRLGPGMDPEFFQDAADVVLHRVLGDEQAFTDLAVVQRPCKEAQNIDLSGRQFRDHRSFGGGGFLFCQFGELTDEFGGHGGVDGRLSGHHGTDGARDVCHPDLLEEVPVSPGLECVEQVGLVLTHREHDDTYLGHCGADTGACLWPCGDRHHHVHEHHVGLGLT